MYTVVAKKVYAFHGTILHYLSELSLPWRLSILLIYWHILHALDFYVLVQYGFFSISLLPRIWSHHVLLQWTRLVTQWKVWKLKFSFWKTLFRSNESSSLKSETCILSLCSPWLQKLLQINLCFASANA